MNERRRRVPPLAPEDRRAAIIAATLPLLRAEGLNVSTRKIAECCGVAEGTIFRAFSDKAALISAALARAFDPQPVVEAIGAIAGEPDVRLRLKTAVRIIMRSLEENMVLVTVLRSESAAHGAEFPDARAGLARIVDAIAELLKPDQHNLRLPVQTIAWLVITMIMHSTRGKILSADAIVNVILDGVLFKEVKAEAEKEILC